MAVAEAAIEGRWESSSWSCSAVSYQPLLHHQAYKIYYLLCSSWLSVEKFKRSRFALHAKPSAVIKICYYGGVQSPPHSIIHFSGRKLLIFRRLSNNEIFPNARGPSSSSDALLQRAYFCLCSLSQYLCLCSFLRAFSHAMRCGIWNHVRQVQFCGEINFHRRSITAREFPQSIRGEFVTDRMCVQSINHRRWVPRNLVSHLRPHSSLLSSHRWSYEHSIMKGQRHGSRPAHHHQYIVHH